jgi:hypothetical protein
LSAKLVPTFEDTGVPCGRRVASLRPYSRLSRPEPLLFLPTSFDARKTCQLSTIRCYGNLKSPIVVDVMLAIFHVRIGGLASCAYFSGLHH